MAKSCGNEFDNTGLVWLPEMLLPGKDEDTYYKKPFNQPYELSICPCQTNHISVFFLPESHE